MKIYSVAMFLMMVNISIAFLVSAQILPVTVETVPILEDTFRNEIPDDLSYSNVDIAIYIFGDFLRGLAMLGKLFIFAPIILPILLNAAGMPTSITGLIVICIWAVYLAGIAQFIAKYSLEGTA